MEPGRKLFLFYLNADKTINGHFLCVCVYVSVYSFEQQTEDMSRDVVEWRKNTKKKIA